MEEVEVRNIIQNHRIFHSYWSDKCEAWLQVWKDITETGIEPVSILNIGVGHGKEADMWMGFISTILPSLKEFNHLELDEDLARKAQGYKSPFVKNITVGNVLEAHEIFPFGRFDLVYWGQGPEHVTREEWPLAFTALEYITGKALIMQCPWGTGYDDDQWHYAKSIRKGEFEDFDFSCLYDGKEDTRDAGITAYKLLGVE